MLRIIIIFIISSFVSFADDYTVTRHVFGSGGATVSNSNYSMSGTVGQSAIGISFSPDNRIIHGFWTAQSIADIQIIALTQGWNIISTYINTGNMEMESIWNSNLDKIVIAKDNFGNIFYPEFEINTIGNWDIYQGYQVFMNSAANLSMTGVALQPALETINLTSGWHIVTYLRQSPMDVEVAVATLTDDEALVIMKDNLGNIYFPEFNINTIGNMLPGQGYQLFLIKPSSLTYPAN